MFFPVPRPFRHLSKPLTRARQSCHSYHRPKLKRGLVSKWTCPNKHALLVVMPHIIHTRLHRGGVISPVTWRAFKNNKGGTKPNQQIQRLYRDIKSSGAVCMTTGLDVEGRGSGASRKSGEPAENSRQSRSKGKRQGEVTR